MKKGQSQILVTILLVLVAIAAIVFVAIFINNQIKQSNEETEVRIKLVTGVNNLDISAALINRTDNKTLLVKVYRNGARDEAINSLIFTLLDKAGKYYSYTDTQTAQTHRNLETKDYVIYSSDVSGLVDFSQIVYFEVAVGVLSASGNVVVTTVIDSYGFNPLKNDGNTLQIFNDNVGYNPNITNPSCISNLVNTTWSLWRNISCLPTNLMNQSRNLTQYDSVNCGSFVNQTIFEYNASLACVYSSPTPSYVCGNSITEPGEACDGTDVNGYTCATVAAGFNGTGILSCNSDCKSYNVSSCSVGKTWNAASCNQNDVQNAINSASDGDIVLVPAGSCVWNSSVIITKGLFLNGEGKNFALITANKTRLFDVDIFGMAFRLSNMGFAGETGSDGSLISLDGNISNLRIDNVRFINIPNRSVIIGYSSTLSSAPAINGVFDNIEYSNNVCRSFMLQYGKDDSWLYPNDYGSQNFIFIENSSFTWPKCDSTAITDGEHGAKFVVRNNLIYNGKILWHDTGSTPQSRGTRLTEIYNNHFFCNVSDCGWEAIGFRGGTGVAYNNIIPIYPYGYENPSASEIYRVSYSVGGKPWTNACDNIIDRICSNFRSHCSEGNHSACSGDWACIGKGICIDACTDNSDCPSGTTCLEKFDGQKDSYGWPCRDQTGRGMDDPRTHVQESSPLFWWNNIDGNKRCSDSLRHCSGGSHSSCWTDSDCGANGPCLNTCTSDSQCPSGKSCINNIKNAYMAPQNANYIKEGRDYYNNTVIYNATTKRYEATYTDDDGSTKQWTYVPYVYPHPLSLI